MYAIMPLQLLRIAGKCMPYIACRTVTVIGDLYLQLEVAFFTTKLVKFGFFSEN